MSYIKSPMNYTGGKYKILGHIIPSFPSNITNFVDLFAGGLNVGVNIDAVNIYANDQITYLIDLYSYIQNTNIEEMIKDINHVIAEYQLDLSNGEGYNSLRDAYNKNPNSLDLFVLTCFSFNHQIRFNSRHEFNTPFGKNRSSYNASIEHNLRRFSEAIQSKNIIFSNKDFREFDYSMLTPGDVVYCDPPYLITTGSYNDGKRGFKDWTKKEDADLLSILDKLDERGVLFGLSNVFYHKGEKNEDLIKWSQKYHINYIDKSYANCSYHFKDRGAKTVEVLITNYSWEDIRCEQMTLNI